MWIKIFVCSLIVLASSFASNAQNHNIKRGPAYSSKIEKEHLGRGLIAVNSGEGRVCISWRSLEEDPIEIGFDILRNGEKINQEPITRSTFYVDQGVDTSHDNQYSLSMSGSDKPIASFTLSAKAATKPYITIPLKEANGMYAPNDATVGDLDGDGEYEIVFKRETQGYDNSHKGLCREPLLIEAYRLNGEFMWRIDMGPNIRQGAHYTQLSLYDFDGDGRSELAIRTAEGTTFGDGVKIGDTDKDGITDYVDRNPQSGTYGKILSGPEFLSIIEGETGKELARTDYIPRGAENEFGDNYGNRADRFLCGAGYFDGKHPSIVICRGYYAKTVIQAWDYRGGKLKLRWQFDTSSKDGLWRDYAGQGNHNLRIGDIDKDGKDEITYGACMIDDDGTGGYNTRLGHGDAMHLTDIDIDREGLEVWQCHESRPSKAGSEMRDAATGELIWGIPSIRDVGRAMAADIDPRHRGVEVWSSDSRGVYSAQGHYISNITPSINMAVWWDGDLNRELLDNRTMRTNRGTERIISLTKWSEKGIKEIPLAEKESAMTNNHTKANPMLQADILGDWREEIVVRSADNKSVRIYTTDIPTEYRFHSLMSDEIYRWSVLTQNVAYNQPTQPGYYLGSDLGRFNKPTHLRGDEAVLDMGFDYEKMEWWIDGKIMSNERKLKLKKEDYPNHQKISITIKAYYKGALFTESWQTEFR